MFFKKMLQEMFSGFGDDRVMDEVERADAAYVPVPWTSSIAHETEAVPLESHAKRMAKASAGLSVEDGSHMGLDTTGTWIPW